MELGPAPLTGAEPRGLLFNFWDKKKRGGDYLRSCYQNDCSSDPRKGKLYDVTERKG